MRGPIGLFGGNRVSTHLITVELGGPILYVGEQVEGSCEVSPRNPLDGMQGAPLGNPIRAAYIPEDPPTGAVGSSSGARQATTPLNLQWMQFSVVHGCHENCFRGGPHRRTRLPRETPLRWLHTLPVEI
jgi:hypothetical protein